MDKPANINEMLDRAEEAIEENKQSFPDKVWRTFRLINIEDQVAQKIIPYTEKSTGKKKSYTLDYISWTTAWWNLMECFPESKVKFHDPVFFGDGTGEQWVTVKIIDGEKIMRRKWFLPYMNHKNEAVEGPSSLQINNTRMRCFTKCMALCGLGIEIYGGEDIPNETHDQVASKSVRAEVLKEIEWDESLTADWILKLQEIMPSQDGIKWQELFDEYPGFCKLGGTTVAIVQGLTSWQRTAIGKVRQDLSEAKRKEAVEKIQNREEPPADTS